MAEVTDTAHLLISRGDEAVESGDLETALYAFIHAWVVAPDDLALARTIGLLFFATGDYHSCAEILEFYTAHVEGDNEVFQALCQAWFHSGRLENALQAGLKAEETGELEVRTAICVALAIANAGRREVASSLLHQVLEVDPQNAEARIGIEALALEMDPLSGALPGSHGDHAPISADHHCVRGYLHAQHGRPEEALREFESALELSPDHEEAARGQVRSLAALGQWERCLEIMTRAERRDFWPPPLRTLKAVALQRLGREDDALAEYASIVLSDRGNAAALAGLAGMVQPRQPAMAAQLYRQAADALQAEGLIDSEPASGKAARIEALRTRAHQLEHQRFRS